MSDRPIPTRVLVDDGSSAGAGQLEVFYRQHYLDLTKKYGLLDLRQSLTAPGQYELAAAKALEMFWRWVVSERMRPHAAKT